MKNIYFYLSQLDKFTQYKKKNPHNYFFNNNYFIFKTPDFSHYFFILRGEEKEING